MVQHMPSNIKIPKNKVATYPKSSVIITLVIMCAAFFITQQISADNVPPEIPIADIKEEKEIPDVPPTEISTEEPESTEAAPSDDSPAPKINSDEKKKEEESVIDEKVDPEETPEVEPIHTKPEGEEIEILPNEEIPESESIDDLTTTNEKSSPQQPSPPTNLPEEPPLNTQPPLSEDIPKKTEKAENNNTSAQPENAAIITSEADETPQENATEEGEDQISADIVISEIHIDGTNDWIELYNQTNQPIDLAAQKYRIERATKSGGDPKYYIEIGNTGHGIFPRGTIIAEHGHYLITDTDASNDLISIADAIIEKKRGFTLTEDNTIYLATGSVGKPSGAQHDDEDIVDYVGYGSALQFEKSPAQNPSSGESLIRKKEGLLLIDTHDNGHDLRITKDPTPINSLGESTSVNEDIPEINFAHLGIRLNEVFPNPKGSDKKGYEFIEVINTGTQKVDLSTWEIETVSKNKTTKRKKFSDLSKESLQLSPGDKKDFPLSLTNTFFTVRLYAPDDTNISETTYSDAKEGQSWNYHRDSWYWSDPTPGRTNEENPQTKNYPEIRINEILPDPRENEKENEFIEFYNPTNRPVALRDWIIKDATKTGHHIFTNEVIPAKGYFVIYRTTFGFALNNTSKETLSLIAPNTKIVSTVSYARARTGQSLNYHPSLWYWTAETPWSHNNDNPLTKNYPFIMINEILPNPIGDEATDEYIELYNPNSWTISLDEWALSDTSKTGLYVFPKHSKIRPYSYIVLYRKDFNFALNNSGTETISLLSPNTKVQSFVTYKGARENVSYNFSGERWRWSKHLTPGYANILNNLPEITRLKIDQKAYRDVYVNFRVKAIDRDHEKLKVRWEFGDGRKSYLWETRHKYTKTGTYIASVRIQDGSEEITKKFSVIVKKYPRRKVLITAILPNPTGKDTEGEYIIVENESKKKIKLRGWSIATGSSEKKLVNHPIREKVTAQPQSSQKITREHAALTLPNKKGVVQLRRPDGSTADTISYDHITSIKNDVLYMKIDGNWVWIEPLSAMSTSKQLLSTVDTDEIIASAWANENMRAQPQQDGAVLGAQIDNDKIGSLTVSSIRTFFEKILIYLTIILHKIVLWIT